MYVHRGTRRSSVITPRVLSPQELETVYAWVDEVPLSRPKKNFARDFSDGCLVAEIVAYHLPKLGLAPRKGWREPSFACGGVQFDKCKHSPLAHNVVLHLLLQNPCPDLLSSFSPFLRQDLPPFFQACPAT